MGKRRYNELKVRLRDYGYTYKSMAKELNLSLGALSKKLNGEYDFKLPEIEQLIELLEIESCEDKCRIFKI